MIDSYLTIKDSTVHKIARKKSRFIALLSPACSHEDAERQIDSIRKAYHDASHHCSAFRLLIDDGIVEGSSDDGEPSGSAGLPMLNQLAGRDVCNILAVVVRYYGGTNLGVGGLVRAYSDAVSEALDKTSIVEQALTIRITIRFPVEVNSGVMSTVHRFSAHVSTLLYEEPVRIDITLPPSQLDAFRAALTEATGARAKLEVTL
ncbi:YigZ family protein [Candidatus Bipolaricaulota bacterium]|nr:YigZ family protein [Candidatus Bipolaricaulota bacterium]